MAFDATQAAQLLRTYISKRWIPALERSLQLHRFTTKVQIPPGMGAQGRVVTFSNPPASTTAITTNLGNPIDITTTGTSITISEYGEHMPLVGLIDYAAVPGYRDEVVKRFVHGANVAIDGLVRNALNPQTTNVMVPIVTSQAGGALVPSGTPQRMNAACVIAASKEVKDAFARGFRGIEGHVDGHYACVIGQQAELDMVTEMSTTRMTWAQAVTNVPGRLGQEKWVEGYIGSIYHTAVYESENLTYASYSSTDVTQNFLLADGAVAAMSLGDMKPEVFVNVPSQYDIGNPFRREFTVAWYIRFGTALHDAARSVKIYSLGS